MGTEYATIATLAAEAEPDEHPAAKPFKRALVEDGIPFTSFDVKDVNAEYKRLVGAGVRFSADHARPYATIAFPLIPKLGFKANVGPHYYTVGLKLGY